MRPVGITLVSFMYITSVSFLMAEVLVLAPMGMTSTSLTGDSIDLTQFITSNGAEFLDVGSEAINPADDGSILDRISLFAQGGYDAIWSLLSLLSGTYFFSFLTLLGLPVIFITVLKLIFGFIVASTIVYYLTGRG